MAVSQGALWAGRGRASSGQSDPVSWLFPQCLYITNRPKLYPSITAFTAPADAYGLAEFGGAGLDLDLAQVCFVALEFFWDQEATVCFPCNHNSARGSTVEGI
jgi:hypothetical protein